MQSLFDDPKSGSHPPLVQGHARHHRQHAGFPRHLPRQPSADRAQRRRRSRADHDALGLPAAAGRISTGHEYPECRKLILAALAETRAALPGAGHQLSEYAPKPDPVTGRKDIVWFSIDESRPLFAFAGLWRPWTGKRGTKANPIEGDHLLYGFLTCEPNAVVKPIHQTFAKAIKSTPAQPEILARLTDAYVTALSGYRGEPFNGAFRRAAETLGRSDMVNYGVAALGSRPAPEIGGTFNEASYR